MEYKTKLQVIEETVAYYSEDTTRRSIGTNSSGMESCLYNGPDGKQCAFARCANPIPAKYENTSASGVLAVLPNILKKEYSKITDTLFWNEVQMLHDADSNWNSVGLTQEGLITANRLKEKYKD